MIRSTNKFRFERTRKNFLLKSLLFLVNLQENYVLCQITLQQKERKMGSSFSLLINESVRAIDRHFSSIQHLLVSLKYPCGIPVSRWPKTDSRESFADIYLLGQLLTRIYLLIRECLLIDSLVHRNVLK